MRLRVFGVPKLLLIAYGLLPTILWSAFHLTSVYYRREEAFWVVGMGILLTSIFTYSFRRGIFSVRYLIYSALAAVILMELLPSAIDRDFVTHGWSLLALFVSIVLGSWLEKRVRAADLNPETAWFEGAPKSLPRVDAQVKLNEEWVQAGVRKIDEQGLFVMVEQGQEYRRGQSMEFQLTLGEIRVQGVGRLRSCFLGEKLGFGLQFLPENLYHFNQYTTLVRRLRGEGL